MSLALRRTLYFKHAVTAMYRMSPVPTSASEVEYIYQSFSKIAPIEYFSVEAASAQEQNLYRQMLTVVLSTWDHASLLNQRNPIGKGHQQLASHLEQRQQELRAFLQSLCGLPRYSHIENDDLYMAGKTEIRFKHSLAKESVGSYTISPSTVDEPFFCMQSDLALGDIVASMRHNFQKFHKFTPMCVRTGVPSHLKPSHSPEVAVAMSPATAFDLGALGDLGQELEIAEPVKSPRHFTGFQV